jgi:HEAT repeat protein
MRSRTGPNIVLLWPIAALVAALVVAPGCSTNRRKPLDRKSTEELLEDLATSDDRVRIPAMQRLSATRGNAVTPSLITLLTDQSEPMRIAAAATLAESKDPSAADALWKELNSRYQSVAFKLAAARSLAGVKDPRAIDYLIQVLPTAGAPASVALAQYGDAALEPLIQALGDASTRAPASATLASMGQPAIAPLMRVLNSGANKAVRLAVVKTLAEFDDQRVSIALNELLQDREVETVAAAYRFLIRQGDRQTEPALIAALTTVGRLEMAEDFLSSGNETLKAAAQAWAQRSASPLKARLSEQPEVYWGGVDPTLKRVNLYHFDGALTSVAGDGPVESTQVAFVPGKWGKAVSVERGGALRYPLARNISFRDGTIEMWISPKFDGGDPIYRKYNHPLLLYHAPNADQFLVSEGNFGGFYAGAVVHRDQAFKGAGGGVFNTWKAGTWHHIAFTYSSRYNRQNLYLDGICAADRSGPMPAPDPANASFTLGCDPYGNWTAFAVDELQITSGEKSAGAIRAAAVRTQPYPD